MRERARTALSVLGLALVFYFLLGLVIKPSVQQKTEDKPIKLRLGFVDDPDGNVRCYGAKDEEGNLAISCVPLIQQTVTRL